jgi:hypothetical protein
MGEQGNIRHLTHAEIDKIKWDACIDKSGNGRIYARSVYLDHIASNWEGLVLNNYEAVMPLTWRKKWGIHYLYQPAFIQQSGIFSINKTDELLTKNFLNVIPDKFLFIEINLNAENSLPTTSFLHKNYLLDINYSYDTLKRTYSRSALRNINKAIDSAITIKEDVNPADIILMHRKRFKDMIGAKRNDYTRFNELVNFLLQQKQVFTAGAFNADSKLIAGSIYLLYKKRITFIINGNSPESLQYGATHLLKDYTIHKFSNQGLIMDFEGSDFSRFARFYEQFGNVYIEYYPSLYLNKLPWPIKLLKRKKAVSDVSMLNDPQ